MKNLSALLFVSGLIAIGCGGGGGGGGTTGATTGLTSGTNGGGIGTAITGRIVQDGNNNAISGVRIVFYDTQGSAVGQATSDANGNFSANVATSARTFTIDPASMPNFVYRSFRFGNFYYIAGDACRPTAPTPVQGQAVSLPGNVALPLTSSPPPPPPPFPCQ